MAKYKKSYKSSRRNNSNGESMLRKREDEIIVLERRIEDESPSSGYVPPLQQTLAFRALPISEATLRGLEEGSKQKSFSTMTSIQNAVIPHALAGRDILGAARTGSGKTLAFLVPLLEKLFRAHVTRMDGPAAIVLSPTRELALQIFQVLRVVGSFHNFSAGILVGGKKEFLLEQAKVGHTNIIIATPGRLLQHLEQTSDFDAGGLLMLVLDEADRILDMGFRDQMVRILEYLPKGVKDGGPRQTLLFSATQTKRVADLAALSLHRPEYIGVHDKEISATPESLEQSMIVVSLEHKLDAVFSFIKTHLRKKSIVFLTSCSQVRHVYELFSSLQPGVPLLALHGKMTQEKRTRIYLDFLQRPHAVLFATDIAARGLDFPNVDWVVQADAPEDKEMYIHRVGRTARYNAGGRSLLIVLPSEEPGMATLLEQAKVPIKKLSINPTKTVTVSQRSSSIVASNANLNMLAKKAFKSYLRSVYLMPNKEIFQIEKLPVDEFALSLGLAATPQVKFLKEIKGRDDLRSKKNVNLKLQRLKEQIKADKLAKKLEKMNNSAKRKVLEDRESDDDDLLVVKANVDWNEAEGVTHDEGQNPIMPTKMNGKIRIDASSTGLNKKIIFNEDGEIDSVQERSFFDREELTHNGSISNIAHANYEFMRRVKERLRGTKGLDRSEEMERIRQKHKKRKLKDRASSDDEDNDGVMVTLETQAGEEDHYRGRMSSDENESRSDVRMTSESSDDSTSNDTDDADEEFDLNQEEDLALALIRGRH